jgi:hypothetical protein
LSKKCLETKIPSGWAQLGILRRSLGAGHSPPHRILAAARTQDGAMGEANHHPAMGVWLE